MEKLAKLTELKTKIALMRNKSALSFSVLVRKYDRQNKYEDRVTLTVVRGNSNRCKRYNSPYWMKLGIFRKELVQVRVYGEHLSADLIEYGQSHDD